LVSREYFPLSIRLRRKFVHVLAPRGHSACAISLAEERRRKVRRDSSSTSIVLDKLCGHRVLVIHPANATHLSRQQSLVPLPSCHAPGSQKVLYGWDAIQQNLSILACVVGHDIFCEDFFKRIPVLIVDFNCISCEDIPGGKGAISTACGLVRDRE
jgi:hypothetical protein